MQAEAVQAIEQTGVIDKLLGPSGGFVLALCGLAALAHLHIKTLKAHAEKIEAKDLEIRRLSDARVEEAKGEARDMIARMEELDDQEGKRWSRLARMLALSEPMGVTLARTELILRAIAKKVGSVAPPASAAGSGSQVDMPTMDEGDEGRSMF